MCKGVIVRPELTRRLRILFPWKLQRGDKCGMLYLETPYLKLCTWVGN